MRVHKPAWQDVEGKLLAVRNHGVPSIRATIEPCHDVVAATHKGEPQETTAGRTNSGRRVLLGKHIRQFSLAFVAPL